MHRLSKQMSKKMTSCSQVLKPPVPPSKDPKSFLLAAEDIPKETKGEKGSEENSDIGKKTGPPPTPPNKPNPQSSVCNLTEPTVSRPSGQPPIPPSKEKKMSLKAVQPHQDVVDTEGENKKEDDERREDTETDDRSEKAVETKEEQSTEEHHSTSTPILITEESEDSVQSIIKPPVSQQEGSENLDAVLQAEDSEPSTKDPSGVCSSNNPLDAGLTTDLLLSHSPKEKQRKAEEKSVDSGQHSDDDSEGSGCEDLLAASSVALQGSQPGLDVLDPCEDEVQILPLNQSKVPPKPHSEAKCFHNPKPAVGLKPYTKVKSASFSDLLSDTVKVTPPVRAGAQGGRNSAENVMKLKTEVAVEIQKTNELFDRVSKVQGCNEPQDLLSEAMEKLKKADHFLRQVHKIKMANNMYNRKSW